MTHRKCLATSIALVVAGMATPAIAQDEQSANRLEELVVIGSRSEQQLGTIPAGISVVNMDDIQLGRQELGLDESLVRVPGLFMQNRYNF